jgi:hypothetical protein
MTVSELIAKLQDMPQDALVVVRGYESGYDDILDLTQCKLKIAEPYPTWGSEKPESPQPWDGVYIMAEDAPIDAVYIAELDSDDKHIRKRAETAQL